jgi:hypothetical protein
LVVGPAVFDRYILALDEARILEALTECAHTIRKAVGRCEVEKSHHRHRRLLRARRQRPCRCRAAEQRDELATFPLMEMH